MISYLSRQVQADQLAQLVAHELNNAIEKTGAASLVLSGGGTPRQFLQSLSYMQIDWSKLAVTTSDERWVALTDKRSNASMVSELLRIDGSQPYKFIPLYLDNYSLENAMPFLEDLLKEGLATLDSIVLGMGTDGHFASLFPGADNLDHGMSLDSKDNVISITAPGAPEPRVSLTLAKIVSSKHIHLLINGADKLETLKAAQQINDPQLMPICALLELENLIIHYAD